MRARTAPEPYVRPWSPASTAARCRGDPRRDRSPCSSSPPTTAAGRQLRRGLAGEGLCAVAGDPTEPASVVGASHRSGARVALVDLELPHAGGARGARGPARGPARRAARCSRGPAAPSALRPALERGAVGCLAGPVRPRRLALAVHAAGRGEPVLSPALTRQLLRELASPAAGGRSMRAASPGASARCSVCWPRDVAPTRSRATSRSRGRPSEATSSRSCASSACAPVRPPSRCSSPSGMLSPMVDAYVGLGANLGDPRAQLEAALARARRAPGSRAAAVSSAYESDPVGPVGDQPPFLNAVAGSRRRSRRARCCAALHEIEDTLGRTRTVRFGPRTCDLDLLLYGRTVLDEPDLVLPHPRLAERRFVLEPLAELAPELVLPDGRRVARSAAGRRATRACVAWTGRLSVLPCVPRGYHEHEPGTVVGRSHEPELLMSHVDDLEEFDAELELTSQARVRDRLRALPVLRAHAGGDVPLQRLEPADRPPAVLPPDPPRDGGRLGVGQEPADADHPEGRRPHHPGRHDRGAEARGRPRDDPAGRLRRAAGSRSSTCHPMRCSRSTSATPRRCSACSTARRSSSAGASRRSASSRPTISPSMLAGPARPARSRPRRASRPSRSRRPCPRSALAWARLSREPPRLHAARDRARRAHGHAGPDRQPERGGARPHRQLRRGARARRRARASRSTSARRRTSTRSRPPASTSAARSRRASRSRWTRSSAARRASSRST